MSKKISAVVVGLFLLGSMASLIAINSFFRENTRLLKEQKRLIQSNDRLFNSVQSLKKRIPPTPKGCIVESVQIQPLPNTEGTEAPRYTVAFWIKNPTKSLISAIQGVIVAQANGVIDPAHWYYWSMNIGPVAPGERKHVVTNPMVLGKPGASVEVLVTLKGQPGIGKAIHAIPDIAPPPAPVEGAQKPGETKPEAKPETKPEVKPGQSDPQRGASPTLQPTQ